MSSSQHGTDTSIYEITNIEKFGFWLYNDGQEYFINYRDYPDFENASVKEIMNVRRNGPEQFHWPDLDIDIELEALKNPEKYTKQFKN